MGVLHPLYPGRVNGGPQQVPQRVPHFLANYEDVPENIQPLGNNENFIHNQQHQQLPSNFLPKNTIPEEDIKNFTDNTPREDIPLQNTITDTTETSSFRNTTSSFNNKTDASLFSLEHLKTVKKGYCVTCNGKTYNFNQSQIQSKWKHTTKVMNGLNYCDLGNYTKPKGQIFVEVIRRHLTDPQTVKIDGSYHKTNKVAHYINETTRLDIMFFNKTNNFISGWLLSKQQLENVLRTGNL